MRPVIGYNFGAGERERVGKIYKITLAMAGVIMAQERCSATISNTLIGAFTDNAETIAAGGAALRIISAGFIVSTVSVTASGALEESAWVSVPCDLLLRYIVVILPSAFILCHLLAAARSGMRSGSRSLRQQLWLRSCIGERLSGPCQNHDKI